MGQEIERKFKVIPDLLPDLNLLQWKDIVQYYYRKSDFGVVVKEVKGGRMIVIFTLKPNRQIQLTASLPIKESGDFLSLLFNRPQIRFRIIDQDKYILGFKSKRINQDPKRGEFEFPQELNLSAVQDIISASPYFPVSKMRYHYPFEGLVWEIDVYRERNKPLIATEVEIPRSDFDLTSKKPNWVGEEITFNRRYGNYQLALHPFQSLV
jgi:adenylate cyclase